MSEAKLNTLKLSSILLGFLSIVNMVLIGIYTVRYCLTLSFLGQRFLMEANLAGFATTISVVLVVCGCYSIYRNHLLRGGICNLIAGTITIGIYLHFTLDLSLFQQFGLLGYFLLVPAPTNGIIGITISKMHKV